MKILSLKKAITITFISIAITTNFCSCSKSGDNPPSTENSANITITSLSLEQGTYATEVDIIGTGFSSVLTDNKVKFNGKDATVYFASSTKITATVPLAAGTGPVTILTGGKTATGPSFKYISALVITPFAGYESQLGFADGKGTAAKFNNANGIAFDKNGNIYVTDTGNQRIRKITPDGTVTTFAGSGARGKNDGLGTQASFDEPTGITADAAGNVYVTDNNSNLIRKITPDGMVTTLAGNLSGVYQDGVGKLAGFVGPLGITVDATGNLFVVETDYRIRKITPDGVVTTFAGNGLGNLANGMGTNAGIGAPIDITIDKTGNLYVMDTNNGVIRKITTDATVSTYFDASTHEPGVQNPRNIAIDGLGNIYLSDDANYVIKVVKPDKTMSVYAGGSYVNGLYGPALKTILIYPQGIAIDAENNVYFTDRFNVKKISVQ